MSEKKEKTPQIAKWTSFKFMLFGSFGLHVVMVLYFLAVQRLARYTVSELEVNGRNMLYFETDLAYVEIFMILNWSNCFAFFVLLAIVVRGVLGPDLLRRVKSTPDPNTFESIAMHLPFLSRYFCKSMPSSWQKVVYTPPIGITIRLPFVSRYFRRSIRLRGCWNSGC